MRTVITGDVWIGSEHAVGVGRTTASGRGTLATSPEVRLTVAQEEALEEAVDRAMEVADLDLRVERLPGTPARAAEPRHEARGLWAAAVAVVRSRLTRSERDRAWDARIEERRDAVRRELLLRQARLW